MLVVNHQLCNRLLGHMSVLRGGCLGLGLEQESRLGVGGFCDLLVMSATGTGRKAGSYLCCTPHVPGELYVEYGKTRFHLVLAGRGCHPHFIDEKTEEQSYMYNLPTVTQLIGGRVGSGAPKCTFPHSPRREPSRFPRGRCLQHSLQKCPPFWLMGHPSSCLLFASPWSSQPGLAFLRGWGQLAPGQRHRGPSTAGFPLLSWEAGA